MDTIGQKAVVIVDDTLGIIDEFDPHFTNHQRAERIVGMLQMYGLIARCTCPVGFGQVRDDKCPAHGTRIPAHTVTMRRDDV